ncbi:MAG: VWA domain-containing protein [Emcibacter sp.]|nr:VWA domain-containing protein [Emcibacter sp.]
MNITFLDPWFLLLIAVLPLLWVMARRPLDKGQLALRSLLLLLVVLALAKPIIFKSSSDKHHIIVVDLTDSLSNEQKEKAVGALDDLMAQMPSGDSHKIIILGNDAGTGSNPHLKDALYISSASSSSVSAALKEAVENIPLGGQGAISLLSDGRATDQNWAAALTEIQDRGIPVHSLDLAGPQDDIYISRLAPDGKMREGQTSKVMVEISGKGAGLQLELYADDKLWATSEEFNSDGTAHVILKVEAEQRGFITLEAKLIVPEAVRDMDKSNNSLSDLVAVAGPLRLLYLGERQQKGAEKLKLLLGTGFTVSEANKNQPLDESFPLDDYDIVVIDDRPARTLPDAFQKHLALAVRQDGLGVFFAGGRSAFGEGGYKKTPMAKLLPVEFRQRDEKKDPSVSLAIVIDSSGSMSGRPLEIAKHMAKLAIKRLKPHDKVGVVEFYGNKQWAVPLQSAANKVAIERAISRMQAGGSTTLYPAVEEAYYGLKNMETRFKHLLVIIDGDMGGDDYEPLIRRMAKDGITVSTILAGQSLHHQEMFDMASWGRGRFYTVGDRFSLVDIILKRERSTKMPAYHPGKHTVLNRTGPGWLGDVESIPDLRGYVETRLKPGGELLLEEKNKKHPLLASWRYGLGRVTSLMVEPLGQGTSGWRDWSEYGAMLGRILSRTAADMDSFSYEISRKGHQVTLTATRTVQDRNVVPVAWVLSEGPEALSFRQRSPDIYQATFTTPPQQAVRIDAAAMAPREDLAYTDITRKISLASRAYDGILPERNVSPAGGLDMRHLSGVTGGELLDGDDLILSPVISRNNGLSLSGTGLWPYLLLLAILTYLIELLYRRWPTGKIKTAAMKFRENG